eukprot:10586546-Alexandrium_andersonii.AAC.1
MQSTPAWSEQAFQDLEAIRRASAKLSELPPPRLDPGPWLHLWKEAPSKWKAIVREATQALDADIALSLIHI